MFWLKVDQGVLAENFCNYFEGRDEALFRIGKLWA